MVESKPKPGCTGTPLTTVGFSPGDVDALDIAEGVETAGYVSDTGSAGHFFATLGIPRRRVPARRRPRLRLPTEPSSRRLGAHPETREPGRSRRTRSASSLTSRTTSEAGRTTSTKRADCPM